MKTINKQRVLAVILSSLVSVFLVAGAVMATTTIGANITTEGTTDLETYVAIGNGSAVSADTALIVDYDRTYTAAGSQIKVLGTVTGKASTNVYGVHIAPESITIPAGTTALAASLYVDEPVVTATGTLTNSANIYIPTIATEASGNSGIQIGIAATPISVNNEDKAIDIFTTSSETEGTVRSVAINTVNAVDDRSTIIEAFRSNVASAYETGDWVNAIVGRIDYTGGGSAAGGTAAAISAEIMFPNESMTSMGGQYNALALEMGMDSSTAFHENANYPYAFLKFSTWGGTEMDDHGYLFYVDGISAAADKLVSLTSHTLKARVGSLDRYVVLSQMQDGLGLGVVGTPMALASTSTRAVDIYTTNALTTGTVRSFNLQQTHTGAMAIAEALTSTVTSNVKMGAWANAIFGKIDFSTNGYIDGQAGVICAELDLPGSTITTGEGVYTAFQAELNCPANCVMNSAPIHVFQVNAWGTNKTQIDSVGYLFQLDGFTAGDTTKMITSDSLADDQGGSGEVGIRIKIGSAVYYLLAIPAGNWN